MPKNTWTHWNIYKNCNFLKKIKCITSYIWRLVPLKVSVIQKSENTTITLIHNLYYTDHKKENSCCWVYVQFIQILSFIILFSFQILYNVYKAASSTLNYSVYSNLYLLFYIINLYTHMYIRYICIIKIIQLVQLKQTLKKRNR